MSEEPYRWERQPLLVLTAIGGAICVLLAVHAARLRGAKGSIGYSGVFTEAMFPWSVVALLCGVAVLALRERDAVADRFDVLGVVGVVLVAPLTLGFLWDLLMLGVVHPIT